MDHDERAARAAWRQAADFEELCALGARFIEGELAYFPGWGAPATDLESEAVAPVLAAANRAGFLTLASQRGAPPRAGADGRRERRRAFVLGFARPATAARLEALAREGLSVRRDAAAPLPLALRGEDAFLVAAPGARAEELALFAEDLGGRALEQLAAAELLWVVDPEWSRDDRLWPALAAALGGP